MKVHRRRVEKCSLVQKSSLFKTSLYNLFSYKNNKINFKVTLFKINKMLQFAYSVYYKFVKSIMMMELSITAVQSTDGVN